MRFLLLVLALAASGAAAQDFDAPLAPEGDRTYRSASGQFTLAVPNGWDHSTPAGEMHQGEVILWHTDSTHVSLLLLPPEHCGQLSAEACADTVLDETVIRMSEDFAATNAGQAEVTTRAHFSSGGKRVTWQTIRFILPPDFPSDPPLHFALVSRGTTHVLGIASSPPGADPNRWRRLVNRIEIAPLADD